MESSYLLDSQKTEGQRILRSTSKKMKIMESTAEGSLDNNPFESLPTEILQKILGYLPVYDRVRVERVCKRWKNVSTERVWRDVQVLYIMKSEFGTTYHRFRESLEKFGKFITMENNELFIGVDELGILKSLVSRAGQHIKKIIFNFYSHIVPTKPILSIIAAQCHNIESIVLENVEKSAGRAFSKLLRVNKQLRSITCARADNIIKILPLRNWKSLNLEYDYRIDKEVWKDRMAVLVENSPSLEKIYLHYVTLNMLADISKCQQLECLNFPCSNEGGIYDQLDSSLLNRLKCLELSDAECAVNSMIGLLSECINLKSLSFFYDTGKLPRKVVRAVLALPKLESLILYTSSVTDKILMRLIKFKCLEFHFPSDSITENGIFKMIMNSECLEKLGISEVKVTMELFRRLAQNTGERRKFLEIEVSTSIYKVALEICKESKIHIIEEKPKFRR